MGAILECIGVEIQGSENARSQKSFDREAAKAKSKDGWQVVAEYESDELVSGSQDAKRG